MLGRKSLPRNTEDKDSYRHVVDRILLSDPELLRRASKYRLLQKDSFSRWWVGGAVYVNRETGFKYEPHHEDERVFVESDNPRYFLCKGGEGSGKSVAGLIKTLERLRRGCNGILGAPDFEHLKKSVWPEFQRWCPPNAIVPAFRHRLSPEWVPRAPFTMVFRSPEGLTAQLLVGGFDDPTGWEGPNVNFAHWDEARRNKTPAMLKVLDGRCRILGPGGEQPQIYLTTTPRKHWMYEYFVGPLEPDTPDLFEDFRADSRVITLRLQDNAAHLAPGYVEKRQQSLSASETLVLVDAEWADEEDTEKYIPNMTLWDACREDLPPLTKKEPMILALDAATGRKNSASDCFAITGVTRHPDKSKRKSHVAVRYCNTWQAKTGKKISFRSLDPLNPGPEDEIRRLCRDFNVMLVVFDPYQLVDLTARLTEEGVVWCEEFGQGPDRNTSDRRLQELIVERRVVHGGHPTLRAHIDNADQQVDSKDSKLRIVKGRGRVDLAVTTSMAVQACLSLNL